MVQRPFELDLLEMKQAVLLGQLENLIADKTLLAEIKQLVGADFSLKNIVGRAFGVGGLRDPRAIDEVRQRLAMAAPGALDTFDKLIEVSSELDRKKNSLIVY